jgi:hypothetical protein
LVNPYVYKTEGDLSRADVVALTLLCRGKDVVEFGIGGSTVLLSQIAKSVVSYEHDQTWIDRIKPKVGLNCEIRLTDKECKDVKGFPCDVIFDDGHSLGRCNFLLEFWGHVRECAILHDGRMTYAGNCLKRFLDSFTIKNEPKEGNPGLPDNPYTGSLERIDWCWLESNMVVLHKRNCTLKYENWKVKGYFGNEDSRLSLDDF